MLKMFGFGAKTVAPPLPITRASPASTTMQLELVRAALRDTLQKHGMQPQWIHCDVLPSPNETAHDPSLVLLNVTKWHDDLMAYAPALEQEVLKSLVHMNATTIPENYAFAWKFSPDCGCPRSSMPPLEFWSASTKSVAAAKEEVKVKLHKKFDAAQSEYDHRSSGFAPTEPGEFR